MKTKFNLFVSIFQIVVGLMAIVAFIIIASNGESVGRWIVTLLLAIAFVAIGIIGVIDYRKK